MPSFTCRKNYAVEIVLKAVDYQLDGININYNGTSDREALSSFIKMLRQELKSYRSDSILCISWLYCPTCIREYTSGFDEIKDHVDYFLAMMLNKMGSCTEKHDGLCKACAHDAFRHVWKYCDEWANVSGLSKEKVVIVFNWHAYQYQCKNYFKNGHRIPDGKCYLECSAANGPLSHVSNRCTEV